MHGKLIVKKLKSSDPVDDILEELQCLVDKGISKDILGLGGEEEEEVTLPIERSAAASAAEEGGELSPKDEEEELDEDTLRRLIEALSQE